MVFQKELNREGEKQITFNNGLEKAQELIYNSFIRILGSFYFRAKYQVYGKMFNWQRKKNLSGKKSAFITGQECLKQATKTLKEHNILATNDKLGVHPHLFPSNSSNSLKKTTNSIRVVKVATFPVVQWLRRHASTAGHRGSIPALVKIN